jgi:quercetin dioxygenase-like cupin family protein
LTLLARQASVAVMRPINRIGFNRFTSASIVALVLATIALAQDPTKVEPKHYHLDFENEHVQVVAVHYGPHEKSAMHEHPGGVVVVVTAGHLKFTDESGKVTEVFAKPGEARWFAPFKHRVENVGDTAYNAVYIGIKGKKDVISGQDPSPKELLGYLLGYRTVAESGRK